MTPLLSRRSLLAGLLAGAAAPPLARAHDVLGGLRGALDATAEGVRSGSDDQTAALSAALDKAAGEGRPLFLPPGSYEVADLRLPARAHLIGVPGESRLVYRGGRFMLRSEEASRCRLEGLAIDGSDLPLDGQARGLVECVGAAEVAIADCLVTGSLASGIVLEGAAGRIAASRVEAVRGTGIHLLQSGGLLVADNVVEDCGDAGIVVQRWEEGGDDTIIRGNRVSRIRARSGGTGQHGNGVNVAQANGVIVADNRIDDCDFSAIRCFSADSVQVSGNVCTRSGETALYVEFAFEGAVVTGNLIDEAANGVSFANLMEHGGRLAVCSGNLVRNLRGVTRLPNGEEPAGWGIAAEADIALTGNVVESARIGLQLGWGPYLRDLAATGNVIRETDIGIGVTVVEGAGPALIAQNLISGARRGAILGMRWAEAVTGDLAADGAERFAHLTIEQNRAG